ncbi:hypothetical protein ElyMa_006405000 [Elysia marginata]|uniref:Uncharacterized protein n=1 Tax=Elysia marginata TaxID=1093978 RepID=A0AAV4HR91_9GAST|nr:hypothetical protein ElyMa_006405000 [Elysia marginata]
MEGNINGKRQCGRKKSRLGNIEETTTRRINECCEVAPDREEWRRTIASNLWQETEQRKTCYCLSPEDQIGRKVVDREAEEVDETLGQGIMTDMGMSEAVGSAMVRERWRHMASNLFAETKLR